MRHPIGPAGGTGMLTRFPSPTAFALGLGAGCPRGRLPLPWKPQASGGRGSHPSLRYSCLHSLFHPLHKSSRSRFSGPWNAPLPTDLISAEASVMRLAPLNCRRPTTRPVSCYALFEGVAASEPTSWLSVQLDFLSHLAHLRDLSCRSGLFPFGRRPLSAAV